MKAVISKVLFLPTLAWNVLRYRFIGKDHWWNSVDPHLILGAFPFPSDVSRLAELGVRAVVNMCREHPGPVKAYRKFGIEQFRIPTIDFTPPSLEDIQRGVRFIADEVSRGKTVYVHCKAGRGRSAALVFCWLVQNRKMKPGEAQKFLQGIRPQIHRNLMEKRSVRDFWESLPRDADGSAGTPPSEA
jgi:atypical dual specificity phosphatase